MVVAMTLLLACWGSMVGCTYERVVRDDMDAWRSMASKPQAQVDPALPRHTSQDQGGWAIQLATFSGNHKLNAAKRLVDYLKEHTTIKDAWVYPQGSDALVMQGRFTEADSPAIQAQLHEVRQMVIEDAKRFEKAQVVAYGKMAEADVQPSDLAQFAGIQGYTLQVAFFDKAGGPQFREAAEAYCRQLRKKNEQAFYYHGPNRSMVTIGLFTDADWEGTGVSKHYGPKIRELQERYPNNLGNGSTIVEKENGQIIGDQPSVLVHLPR